MKSMLEKIEFIFRWIFCLQIVFWGFNGFLHFFKIPPAGEIINNFTAACIQTKFIMPAVKLIEVVCGILILCNIAVSLNLLILAPVIFVISLLQLMHSRKPWSVILPITVPFMFLFFWHCRTILVIAAQ